MPRPAGGYDRLLAWGVYTLPAGIATGTKTPTYPPAGNLWAAVEDLDAATVERLDADQAEHRATIRIRNAVGVKPGDRLTDAGYGEVWTVEDVRRGDDETVCGVKR